MSTIAASLRPHLWRLPLFGRRQPRGRILAVKWGYNPNSSSLGVDVTFLLFGLSIITLLTPLVGLVLRLRKQQARLPGQSPLPSRASPSDPPTAGELEAAHASASGHPS